MHTPHYYSHRTTSVFAHPSRQSPFPPVFFIQFNLDTSGRDKSAHRIPGKRTARLFSSASQERSRESCLALCFLRPSPRRTPRGIPAGCCRAGSPWSALDMRILVGSLLVFWRLVMGMIWEGSTGCLLCFWQLIWIRLPYKMMMGKVWGGVLFLFGAGLWSGSDNWESPGRSLWLGPWVSDNMAVANYKSSSTI